MNEPLLNYGDMGHRCILSADKYRGNCSNHTSQPRTHYAPRANKTWAQLEENWCKGVHRGETIWREVYCPLFQSDIEKLKWQSIESFQWIYPLMIRYSRSGVVDFGQKWNN